MNPSLPRGQISPLLIVLSGPSGVGKDAVLTRMREQRRPYHFTITTTTRPRRVNETNGLDYTFVSVKEFRKLIDRGELLEWAEVYGNMYGVPKSQVIDPLRNGTDVIIKVDIQGSETIRKLAPDAVFIFLASPSIKELSRRLSLRMTESPETLKLRLNKATDEMKSACQFDHVVVNHRGGIDEAIKEIQKAISLERQKDTVRSWDL